MENDVAKKPPIGVIPQYIWLEKRIVDIQRAIHEYTEMGIFEPTIKWAVELKDVLFIRNSVEMPAGKKENSESPENVLQQTIPAGALREIADLEQECNSFISNEDMQRVGSRLGNLRRQLLVS